MNARLSAAQLTFGYRERMLEVAAAMRPRPGEVVLIEISHDPWCPALAGNGYCACDPDVTLHRTASAS